MNEKELAKIVQEVLDQYIPDPKIPLHFHDPFTLLVAVILSAQCTDVCVNRVSSNLFRCAPTPEAMCACSLDQIADFIRPCGLAKRKSKALLELAHILVEKHRGKVPKSFEELEALPGVGHKTASVVLGEAFDMPAFPVDTHIYRVALRWGLSRGKNVEEVERDLKRIFPEKSWHRLHLQMILFARNYCKARGHDVRLCPMCVKCMPMPGR